MTTRLRKVECPLPTPSTSLTDWGWSVRTTKHKKGLVHLLSYSTAGGRSFMFENQTGADGHPFIRLCYLRMERVHGIDNITKDGHSRERRSTSGHRYKDISDKEMANDQLQMHLNRRRRKTAPDIRMFTFNAATTLLAFYTLCWIVHFDCRVEACQSPLRPIYNATQRQYVSCNAWEPDCPQGSYCQMATVDWKGRLQINTEYTLFLCCADESVFKNTQSAAIVPPTQPTPKEQTTMALPPVTPAPFFPSQGQDPTRTEFFGTTPFAIGTSLGNGNGNWNGSGNGNGNGNGSGTGKAKGTTQSSGFIGQQPPGVPRPSGAGPGSKNPMLPPQAQIMLPGNGNRVIEGPQVIQLVVGEINQSGPDGMYKYSGSVTLVQDSGLNILVDSGSAQNRNKLLAALAQQGIKPQNIQVIVYTHAHPDHIGNDNLFPYAQKMYSTTVYKGDEYMPLQHLQEPSMRLTQNVEVWQTPGHTYQHNSVIVRNVPTDGSVAITGDLFMSEEGMTNAAVWQAVSVDKEVQQQMRNMILCQVEFIIPGHGAPFKVTPEYKGTANCAGRKKVVVNRNRNRNRLAKPNIKRQSPKS